MNTTASAGQIPADLQARIDTVRELAARLAPDVIRLGELAHRVGVDYSTLDVTKDSDGAIDEHVIAETRMDEADAMIGALSAVLEAIGFVSGPSHEQVVASARRVFGL